MQARRTAPHRAHRARAWRRRERIGLHGPLPAVRRPHRSRDTGPSRRRALNTSRRARVRSPAAATVRGARAAQARLSPTRWPARVHLCPSSEHVQAGRVRTRRSAPPCGTGRSSCAGQCEPPIRPTSPICPSNPASSHASNSACDSLGKACKPSNFPGCTDYCPWCQPDVGEALHRRSGGRMGLHIWMLACERADRLGWQNRACCRLLFGVARGAWLLRGAEVYARRLCASDTHLVVPACDPRCVCYGCWPRSASRASTPRARTNR